MREAAPHLCAPLAALHPAREATRCGGRVRSGAELRDRVAALACALRARLGVTDGAVVALAAQSTDALLEAWLAVAAAGAVAAPLNPRWCALAGVSFRALRTALTRARPQEHCRVGRRRGARGRLRAAVRRVADRRLARLPRHAARRRAPRRAAR